MAVPIIAGFLFSGAGGEQSLGVTALKPAGVVAGDLLLILVGNEDHTGDLSFPKDIAGWTNLGEMGSDYSDVKRTAYWRVADGTEPSSVTIHWLTGRDAGGAWYLRITGANISAPFELLQEGGWSEENNATFVDVLGLSPRSYNSLMIAHISYDGGGGLPFTVDGIGWAGSLIDEQSDGGLQNGWSGGFATKPMIINDPSETCVWSSATSDGWIGTQFHVKGL